MNDCIHGQGLVEYKDYKYSGDWSRNRMDGNGVFTYEFCSYAG